MARDQKQRKAVMQYMLANGSITSDEAWRYLGVTRLSDVIFKMRKDGIRVETDTKMVETRYGKAEIAVYKLVEEH